MSVINKEVLLTKSGYKRLEEELEFLIKIKRQEVAERIKDARTFGDLDENPEYHDAKYEQALLEQRISQIDQKLKNATILDTKKVSTQAVSAGSLVTVQDLGNGELIDYFIVGSTESDPSNRKISNESPVGKALIGKKIDEIVSISVPKGLIEYKIIKIRRPSKN